MATKKINTDLKLTDIRKQAKEMYQKESYELSDGKTITFYPIFPESEINNLYKELQQHMITLNKKEIEQSEEFIISLIYIMTIKYFTHFKKDFPSELLGTGQKAGLLDYLTHFTDTGLLKTIIDEVFLKDQVAKVLNKVTDIISTSQVLQELEDATQKKITNLRLKHQDTFEQIGNFETGTNNVSNVLADK